MTVQLSPDLEERLDRLAAQTHRDSGDLAREGLAGFLAYRESLERAVEESRAAIERGDVLDHAEAVRLLDQLLDDQFLDDQTA